MPLISTLISALFITIVLIPWLMRHAELLQLVDQPNERKVHTHKVPRVGGIAMVIGMLVPFLVWFPKDQLFVGLLLGTLILAFFGIWDDRSDLDFRVKFAGQILAALAVVVVGDVCVTWIPFLSVPVDAWWISYPLTVFCLLAIINAMNLADGLDGLAGGASILSFGLVGLMAFQFGSYAVVIVTLAVAGAILGFLRFNSHPARIFMGDTGSQFLGFILGVLVILMTQKVNAAMSPVLPLLIFGLPVIDTFTVMVRRIANGRSPFAPDKNHVHHRLLAMGFTHYETVVWLYFIQFGFVTLAYLLRFYVDSVVMGAFVAYSTLVLVTIHVLQGHDLVRRHGLSLARLGSGLVVPLRPMLQHSNIARLIHLVLLLVLISYSLQAVLRVQRIPLDIAMLAGILAALAAVNLASRTLVQWADAISMYTCCALLAYLGYVQGTSGAETYPETYLVLDWLLVLVLGALVWLAVVLSPQRKFETSPLDILVILLAVLAPLLSVQVEGHSATTLAVVKFVVLLYAFEFMRNGERVRDLRLVRSSVVAGMLVVCSSAIWGLLPGTFSRM